MLETIAVVAIVAAAALWLARRATARSRACGSGCGACARRCGGAS
jgi:hypothetical protein